MNQNKINIKKECKPCKLYIVAVRINKLHRFLVYIWFTFGLRLVYTILFYQRFDLLKNKY
jgi:hypothetical protein